MIGCSRAFFPMPNLSQVRWLMKLSVAPLSSRAVCAAIARAVETGTVSFILLTLLMYILRVYAALNQAGGWGRFKNPAHRFPEPSYPGTLLFLRWSLP